MTYEKPSDSRITKRKMHDSQILNGDSLNVLKTMPDESIDAVITDPPYGYSFMGKDWDRAVPSVDIWRECLRVLKPGGWCMVMSAPRSDVQNAMISRLMEAGFRLDFTPIYWTYASGFPKAGDVAKIAMKKLGDEGEVTGTRKVDIGMQGGSMHAGREVNVVEQNVTRPTDPRIVPLQGAKTGFQPKPAVEVVIVAMKPLSEKTYVDQALKNGKGITWLDDCRVPAGEGQGRFPANLLVSDDVLNDGKITKSPKPYTRNASVKADVYGKGMGVIREGETMRGIGDSGSYSRYFDLDAWADTLPFLAVPKASKSEKNKGLEHLPKRQAAGGGGGIGNYADDVNSASGKYGSEKAPANNHHPTVKPLKLMSYLITLTTRPGDVVLDPFVGSGTTAVAAKKLGRIGVGIEREQEYAEIAAARLFDASREPEAPKQLSLVDELDPMPDDAA